VAAKVSYSGYLTRKEPESLVAWSDADGVLGERHRDVVLCLVGGGQDGSHLAETFARIDFPAGTTGVILTGPFMPPQVQNRLRRQAQKNRRLRVLGFVTDSDLLLRRASRVVAMGGYNTICEILASKKAALIIPRVTPRQEQLIRAQRMQELGLVDVLHPKDLSPRTLRNWLASRSPHQVAVGSRNGRPGDGPFPIDLQGLDRLPQLLQKLIDSPPRSKPDAVAETRLPKRSNPYAVI
jgi:predicted glycosyltransferase